MKKTKFFLVGIFMIFFITCQNIIPAVNASNFDFINRNSYSETQLKSSLTTKGFLFLYFNMIWEGLPSSYKYIKLEFKNIIPNTAIYEALQKWVYLDLIKNKPITLDLDKKVTEDLFYKMIFSNFEQVIDYTPGKELTLKKFFDTMENVKAQSVINQAKENQDISVVYQQDITNISNFPILNDVYLKLKNNHYDSSKFKDEELIWGAIKWMAESTGDKYTTFLPPTESKNFQDELSWNFEWIWAHVEMTEAWIIKIVSPISWSPSEKAWLKSWDIIIKVDELEITPKVTLQEAVNKIKWPAWTTVNIKIKRWEEVIEIKIVRAIINIKYVEYKKLDNQTYYLKISMFWNGTYKAFATVIEQIEKDYYNNQKFIIDLRNNPWWSLDEVDTILNFFVPQWMPVVNIKYKNFTSEVNSLWSEFNFIDKKIIILINEWSASASEIMAWTIRDYVKNVKIIWEKSYGKWSVQSLDSYLDNSSFKYTIAKWFTWKTKTWIDWIGIEPDIEIKFDDNAYKNGIDNQLNYAQNYQF